MMEKIIRFILAVLLLIFCIALFILEEIKNRSCSTCKYGRSFHFDKDIECMKLYDATQGLCFEKDFYCKNWEQK